MTKRRLTKRPSEGFVRVALFLTIALAAPLSLDARAAGPEKVSAPAKAAAAEKAAASSTPAEVAPAPYIYNPAGKPDPFRPFIEKEIAKKKMEVKKKALAISPLERAGIEEFRLVGIGGDERHRTAVVEQANGKKFYPLFVGSGIGLNDGRVVQILSDRVIVEEPLGKKKVKRLVIKLRDETQDEGKP